MLLQYGRGRQHRDKANDNSPCEQDGGVAKTPWPTRPRVAPQGHTDADLARAPCHRVGHHSVEADDSERDSEPSKRTEQHHRESRLSKRLWTCSSRIVRTFVTGEVTIHGAQQSDGWIARD